MTLPLSRAEFVAAATTLAEALNATARAEPLHFSVRDDVSRFFGKARAITHVFVGREDEAIFRDPSVIHTLQSFMKEKGRRVDVVFEKGAMDGHPLAMLLSDEAYGDRVMFFELNGPAAMEPKGSFLVSDWGERVLFFKAATRERLSCYDNDKLEKGLGPDLWCSFEALVNMAEQKPKLPGIKNLRVIPAENAFV
jgi:hypothetical protein